MKKKLLLIFPNTSNRGRIATSIPILGGIARDRGWEATYFDTSFYEKSEDSISAREKTGGFIHSCEDSKPEMMPQEKLIPDLQEIIDSYDPDIVAVTAMTCDYEYLMTFFPQIRMKSKTVVIIGGLHATFKEDEVLDTGLFDLVCFGQGERTFDEILSSVETNSRMYDILGTCFKDKKNGRVVHNPRRRLLPPENLWKTEPEYSFFDERYFRYPFDGKTINMFWLDLGRGCPYDCSYCGNTVIKNSYKGLGQYVVSCPLDLIISNAKKVVKKFNVDIFNITHECFLAQPKSWLEEFAEMWGKHIRKSFLIVTRAETVTLNRLNILRKTNAPLIQIGLGVESGSERVLHDICNRSSKLEQTCRAYELIHRHGFRSSAYWMVGFPSETREDIFQSIDLCKKIDANVDSVSIFQPMPGQPLTELCIKEGLITGKEKASSFTEKSILKMPQISADEIANLRRVFLLYAKLSRDRWSDIEKCEKNYKANKGLFAELIRLRWEYAEQKMSAGASA